MRKVTPRPAAVRPSPTCSTPARRCAAGWAASDELNALEGDLSAVEGLSLAAVEQHADAPGPTARGLSHCATRALETLRRVRELHERIADAAVVVNGNDPTRLSAAACRGFRPGPHVSTYGAPPTARGE